MIKWSKKKSINGDKVFENKKETKMKIILERYTHFNETRIDLLILLLN